MANDEFAELKDLLGDDSPAVKKTAAKKTAPAPAETSETLETSIPVPTSSSVSADDDPTVLRAMLEQALATLQEQSEQIAALKNAGQPTVRPGEYSAAAVTSRQAVPIDMQAVARVDAPPASGGELIHFLEDGFTLGTTVYYRGQQVEVDPEMAALTGAQQRLRYGKVMFGQGPWPGQGYDLDDPNLTPDERQKLAALVTEQQKQFAAVGQRLFEAQRR